MGRTPNTPNHKRGKGNNGKDSQAGGQPNQGGGTGKVNRKKQRRFSGKPKGSFFQKPVG